MTTRRRKARASIGTPGEVRTASPGALGFLSGRHVVENATVFARAAAVERATVRASYVAALNERQEIGLPSEAETACVVADASHEAWARSTVERFVALDEPLQDESGLATEAFETTAARLRADLGRLAGVPAARVLLGALVVSQHAPIRQGSASHFLGIVCLRPRVDGTYREALLHEAVHQALFLEDAVRGVFDHEQAALVPSPLRAGARSYEAAFHAAAVAFTLAHARRRAGNAAGVAVLVARLTRVLPELERRSDCLTGHGRGLLGELRAGVARLGAA